MQILFVCTGNICRSPMAAAIARDALARSGRRDVEVVSAGTYALEGQRPTSDAAALAEEHGLSLGEHRAQQLTRELAQRRGPRRRRWNGSTPTSRSSSARGT